MKIVKKENIRVMLEVESLLPAYIQNDKSQWERVQNSLIAAANNVKQAVERHIDGLERNGVSVVYNEVAYCSHCGYEWELAGDGFPLCCQGAINEHEKSLLVIEK